MGTEEVTAFLTNLAVNRKLAAASQNQALNALVFLYREVLKVELAGIVAVRAKKLQRLRTEERDVFTPLDQGGHFLALLDGE